MVRKPFSVVVTLITLVVAIGTTAKAENLNVAGCSVPMPPPNFKVEERFFSLMASLDVSSDHLDIGRVTKKFFAVTRSFYWNDPSGTQIATAREQFFSWGTTIDVLDCKNRKIGTIKEQVLKSLLKVVTFYSILDSNGAKIAESEKVDWISTDFTLHDQNGKVVATLHRPWVNFFTDTWTVNIQDVTVIDPRIVVMIGAYKTDVDNQRRHEADEQRHQK